METRRVFQVRSRIGHLDALSLAVAGYPRLDSGYGKCLKVPDALAAKGRESLSDHRVSAPDAKKAGRQMSAESIQCAA